MHCREPEGSVPHSQVLATCPYSEPQQSSPCPSHPTSGISILILSLNLSIDLLNDLLPSGFPTKNPACTSPFSHTCHMPRLSHSSTDWYLLRNTDQFRGEKCRYFLQFIVINLRRLRLMPSGTIIPEAWSAEDLKESGCGQISVYFPAFNWRDRAAQ